MPHGNLVMAAIDQLRFNWLPQKSMWQEVQDQRDRQASIQDNADIISAITSKLTNAATTNFSQQGNLAAKAALARIKAASAAKQAKQQAQADLAARNAPVKPPAPTSISLSDGTVINVDASITLAGGTKINTKDGTLTLADGTLVNILTGQKVDVSA
jgi:hypothetical protein